MTMTLVPQRVTVRRRPDVFRLEKVETTDIPWSEGMVAGDVLEPDEVSTLWVNGRQVEADHPIERGDTVDVVGRPGGVETLIAIGLFIAKSIAISAFFALVNYAINAVFGKKPEANDQRSDSSQVYSWGPPRTEYQAQGYPVPRVFGRYKYAGLVIGQYVRTIDDKFPTSYLYLDVLLGGGGPFTSIGGLTSDANSLTGDDLPDTLTINGNSAKNYDAVEAWIRLGNTPSAAAEPFGIVRREYVVDLLIDQGDGSPSDPVVTDFSNAAVYDMPSGETASSGWINLEFPSGLYDTGSSGLKTEGVRIQVQYVELDELGNETGPTVTLPGSDPSEFYTIKKKIAANFTYSLPIKFFDADEFSPGTPTNAASLEASNRHYGTTDQLVGAAISTQWAGFPLRAFTMSVLVRLESDKDRHPVVGWCDYSDEGSYEHVRGFLLSLESVDNQLAEAVLRFGSVVDPAAGDDETEIRGGVVTVGEWAMLTVSSYLDPGVGYRVRLYVDGTLVQEVPADEGAPFGKIDDSFFVGTIPSLESSSGATNFLDGEIDELVMWSREFTPAEVAALYNAGFPAQQTTSDPDLDVGWHFNAYADANQDSIAAFGNAPNVTSYELELPRGITGFVEGRAFDTPVQASTLLRRWRIRVQRVDAVKGNNVTKDEVRFGTFVGEKNLQIGYPSMARVCLAIQATDQLNDSRPDIGVECEGPPDPTWDGQGSANPPTLVWQHTRNPAWHIARLALTKPVSDELGIDDLDWATFYECAQRCDERVYDQRGKYKVASIKRVTEGPNDYIEVGCVGSIPSSFLVGEEVRFAMHPNAFPFVSYDGTITEVEETDPGEFRVRIAYPLNGGAVANELANSPDLTTGWSWVGTSGTVTPYDTTLPIPDAVANGALIGHLVTFPASANTRLQTTETVQPSTLYTVRILVGVGDGAGVYSSGVVNLGTSTESFFVLDDGELHDITFVLQSPAGGGPVSAGVGIGSNGSNGTDRDLFVAGVAIYQGDVTANLPDWDFKLPTIAREPQNVLSDPNSTDRGDSWTPSGTGTIPVLKRVDTKAVRLPIYASGRMEEWQFDNTTGSSLLQQDITLPDAAEHLVLGYFAVLDDRGNATIAHNLGASAGNISQFVFDNGTVQVVPRLMTSGTSEFYSFSQNANNGPRRLAVGALFAAPTLVTKQWGYDGGATDGIGQAYGVEPRHTNDLVVTERNMKFWPLVRRIAANAAASPVLIGRTLRLIVSKPREPTFVISDALIEEQSMQVTRSKGSQRYNSGIAEIQAEEYDYLRTSVPYSPEGLSEGTGEPVRVKTFDLRGVTRRSHARRLMAEDIEAQRLVNKTVTWRSPVAVWFYQVGDVGIVASMMPGWSSAAKVNEDSATTDVVTPDTDMVLGQVNVLDQARDLSDRDVWEVLGGTGATVAASDVPEPSKFGGRLAAWEVSFPGTIGEGITQRVTGHADATTATAIVWAYAKTATDHVSLRVRNGAGSTLGAVELDATAGWNRFAVEVTTGGATTLDVDLVRTTTGSTAVLELTRPRFVWGDDDGKDAIGVEFTGPPRKLFVGVTDETTDAVELVECDLRGRVLAGEEIRLAEGLPAVALAGAQIIAGYGSYSGRLVQITKLRRINDMTVEVTGVEFSNEVFERTHPDDFEPLDDLGSNTALESGSETQGLTGPSALLNGDLTPEPPTSVAAIEDNTSDPDTGMLEQGVEVSWSPEPKTLSLVREWIVSIRELPRYADTDDDDVDEDPWRTIASVPVSQQTYRISRSDLLLERGKRYQVAVQANGLRGRFPVTRSPVTTFTFGGYFRKPADLTTVRADLNGLYATYYLDSGERRPQGATYKIQRGGAFIALPVGTVPAGATIFGPTPDWVAMDDNQAELTPPTRVCRVLPNGAQGEFLASTNEVELQGWPSLLSRVFAELGWTTDATLTDLEEATAAEGQVLRWPDANSSLTAEWESPLYTVGRARLVHLGAAIDGIQEHPLGGSPPTGNPARDAFWIDEEGPTDPQDPNYGKIDVVCEIDYSIDSDDTGEWREYQPGYVYLQVFRFRLRFTRPSADWNMRVTRFGYVAREMPGLDMRAPSSLVYGAEYWSTDP